MRKLTLLLLIAFQCLVGYSVTLDKDFLVIDFSPDTANFISQFGSAVIPGAPPYRLILNSSSGYFRTVNFQIKESEIFSYFAMTFKLSPNTTLTISVIDANTMSNLKILQVSYPETSFLLDLKDFKSRNISFFVGYSTTSPSGGEIYTVTISKSPTVLIESDKKEMIFFPNPYLASVFIQLPSIALNSKEKDTVNVFIFDSVGNLVKTVAKDLEIQGLYNVSWDLKDDKGNDIKTGTYIIFAKFKSGQTLTRRVYIVR